MERIPEPELMEDPAQAVAYARADFREVNAAFVEGVRAALGGRMPVRAVDLGCGPGDIPARLAAAFPGLRIVAVDGSAAMIRLARERLAAARPGVVLVRALVPATGLRERSFDLVVSNSLVHHLRDPAPFWETVLRLARPGAAVHVMDLRRPSDPDAARALVEAAARGEDPLLQRDFHASLLAAFTPEEIRAHLPPELAPLGCRVASDRHWVVSGQISTGRTS